MRRETAGIEEFLRQRKGHAMPVGEGKGQTPGIKLQIAAGLCPVFPVADQGIAPGGELNADLMGAARKQAHLEQRSRTAAQDPVGKPRLPDAVSPAADHIGLVFDSVMVEKVGEGPFRFRQPFTEGKVFLFKVRLHGLGEKGGAGLRFCKDHQPRCLPVQTVNGENGARQQKLRHGAPAGGVGCGEDIPRLDADQQVRVLIQYRHFFHPTVIMITVRRKNCKRTLRNRRESAIVSIK